MRPTAVHQFVASLVPNDAVGSHTLRVRDVLRDLGFHSEIYVHAAAPELRRETRPYRSFVEDTRADGSVWMLYQASTGTPMAEWIRTRPEPLIVNFHNLTPPRYFEAWAPRVAVELEIGHRQLLDLARTAVLGIGVSNYNVGDLQAHGFARTAVAPFLFDPDELGTAVDERAVARLRARKATGGSDLLFVGRVVPHKAQHDLIKALAVYRHLHDPDARLSIVGAPGPGGYADAVAEYAERLGLAGAVEMTGSVPAGVLAAHYVTADVFVCLSEHEGFCIPLLEAMHHEVPVVALAATAVPETLGNAGVLLADKQPSTVAAAVGRVVGDPSLRRSLVAAGRTRLAEFSLDRSRQRFSEVVAEAIEVAG